MGRKTFGSMELMHFADGCFAVSESFKVASKEALPLVGSARLFRLWRPGVKQIVLCSAMPAHKSGCKSSEEPLLWIAAETGKCARVRDQQFGQKQSGVNGSHVAIALGMKQKLKQVRTQINQ